HDASRKFERRLPIDQVLSGSVRESQQREVRCLDAPRISHEIGTSSTARFLLKAETTSFDGHCRPEANTEGARSCRQSRPKMGPAFSTKIGAKGSPSFLATAGRSAQTPGMSSYSSSL